jgi:hypothetical protein
VGELSNWHRPVSSLHRLRAWVAAIVVAATATLAGCHSGGGTPKGDGGTDGATDGVACSDTNGMR